MVRSTRPTRTLSHRFPAATWRARSGRRSWTRRPPPSGRMARSARSGCTATTWALGTGVARRRPRTPSRPTADRAPTPAAARRNWPRRQLDAHRRLRRVPSTVSCTSPAASRTWSSSTAATTTRRTWSTPRTRPAPRCGPVSWRPSRCRPTSCRRSCSIEPSGLKYDPDDGSEQLVIVAERGTGAAKLDPEPIADAVRAAISQRHGVTVRDLLLVPAGSIPRTSSGKIARRACRQEYLDGTLRGGRQQQSFPDAPVDEDASAPA